MEAKPSPSTPNSAATASERFPLGKQSSLKPGRCGADVSGDAVSVAALEAAMREMGHIRLMYLAHEHDLEGLRALLDEEGANPNYADDDGRTPLHVACCEGFVEGVKLLLDRGADPDPEDRWGSTPLADAIHYQNKEVIKLLEQSGAKIKIPPMHVKSAGEVPEYEIDKSELDFAVSRNLYKGTYSLAKWRGINVAVKQLDDSLIADEDKVRAFRDELALLQLLRHPNVVQFLGAVTQSSPMMIVTEYLPKGDLRAYLKDKKALHPPIAVKFALDIARGMNYLHEHKPEAIIHRDLEPSNILLDDSGHLKVADFGVSKLLKWTKTINDDKPVMRIDTAWRYLAPEVFRNEEYDTKVDVFSFGLILQEMIEGCPPFVNKDDSVVPKLYSSHERPPFKAPSKFYAHGLKELIKQCWSDNPADRPCFKVIIDRLVTVQNALSQKRSWKTRQLSCFQNLEGIWRRDHSSSSSNSERSTDPSI